MLCIPCSSFHSTAMLITLDSLHMRMFVYDWWCMSRYFLRGTARRLESEKSEYRRVGFTRPSVCWAVTKRFALTCGLWLAECLVLWLYLQHTFQSCDLCISLWLCADDVMEHMIINCTAVIFVRTCVCVLDGTTLTSTDVWQLYYQR